jgi:HEPN domain-containing protein
MNDRTDASAWVVKAEHDLTAVDLIGVTSDAPWDIVVFHAQQAAEKFLKALLVSRGQVPPKVHDLTKLLAICVDDAPELAQFADDCAFLSPLAVLSRYPGDEPETAREDAEKGVQIARRIRAAVLGRLQPEAP